MAIISFIQLAELLDSAGFPAGTSQAEGCAIVAAESGRDPAAKHINADGSIDRGLWQINNVWHPEVTDECAYDPVCSTAAALKISSGGTNYGAWSTFKSGAYEAHMEAAHVALAGAAIDKKLKAATAQITNLQNQLTGANTQITTLTEQVNALQSDLTALQAKVAQAEKDLQ